MPKILITGNGFDLNLNLPTRYSQIIKLLDGLDTPNKNIKDLYSLLELDNKNELTNTYDISKIEEEKSLVKELFHLKEKNNWLSYFKEEYDIETWIDFENKIGYAINIISESIDTLNANAFSKGSIKISKNNTFSYTNINNNIEYISLLEKFEIISVKGDNNFKLNNSYLKKRSGYLIKINKEEIFNKLHLELIDLKEILNLYFLIFVFPLYNVIKDKPIDSNLFEEINFHYTFNYTPSFEKFYKSTIKTKYLHGKVDKIKNNIVLGVSNHNLPKINKAPNITNFLKNYQKLTLDTDYRFINNILADPSNSSSYNEDTYFFFFGHSLDFSDKDYLLEIIEFVEKSNNTKTKIVIIIKDSKSKGKLIKNLFLVIDEKKIEKLKRNDIILFVENESDELRKLLKITPKSPLFN